LSTASLHVGFLPFLGVKRRDWLPLFSAVAAGLAVAFLVFALTRTLKPQVPLALSLRENSGLLHIGWSRDAASRGATLQILDGSQQMTLFVTAPLAHITYAARTADVQVRLTPYGKEGRIEIARYLVREPSLADVLAQFKAALADAHQLQSTLWAQSRRLSTIESGARILSAYKSGSHKSSQARPKNAETMWWR
jgi:hypothetical protein